MDYNEQMYPWFSPIEIINRFEHLRAFFGSEAIYQDSLFKRAKEMFGSAVALLGAYEMSSENKYFLQSNQQSASPDVMAAKQIERERPGLLLEMVQMEITEFEDHFENDDIVEFLQKVKLRKINNPRMMIVCFVNRVVPLDHRVIHIRLKKLTPKSTIYVVGRPVGARPGTFTIFTPYPKLTKPLEYNVDTTAGKYSIPPRIRLHLGIENKITYTKAKMESINTYNILGIDQIKIKKKYNKI